MLTKAMRTKRRMRAIHKCAVQKAIGGVTLRERERVNGRDGTETKTTSQSVHMHRARPCAAYDEGSVFAICTPDAPLFALGGCPIGPGPGGYMFCDDPGRECGGCPDGSGWWGVGG